MPPPASDRRLAQRHRVAFDIHRREPRQVTLPKQRHAHIGVDNRRLLQVNQSIEAHPVEKVGATLRGYMTAMKQIAVGG